MRTYALRSLALALLLPLTAAAEVKVKTLPDGTKEIFNENKAQRARRTSGSLQPVPSSQVRRLIDLHARRQGLAPRLVQAVVQVESGYNVKARSHKGAMGLMQLMPETARELNVSDAYDAEQNVRGGTTYLRRMLRKFSGNLTMALAAYNAGPTAVEKYGGVPPYRETRNYVRKVLGLYYGTSSYSPRWLLQDHARAQSRQRDREARQAATTGRSGERVYTTRDANGLITVTTSPKSN